jgi:hypothetical protein
MDPIRRDLPEAIHQALRAWHTGTAPHPIWRGMLIAAHHPAESSASDLNLVVRQLVLTALAGLEERGSKDAAQLLRLRFVECLTAAETAQRMNLTEDVVYKRQRAGLEALAAELWRAESEARVARELRIGNRLEIKVPPRLFGVADKLAELQAVIAGEGPPWLVAVVGIGGIGKTSLADAAVRTLASGSTFVDIGWISARQERFAAWDGAPVGEEGAPALTFEALLDALVDELGCQEVSRLGSAQKRDALRSRLKVRPHLVVVDNLETAADYRALVPEVQQFVNPSKVLFTSRRRLHEYPGVHNLLLDELSEADSLALVRHEAAERGLADIASSSDASLLPVYEVAGGNPLALKLLVGHMHTLSLSRVVQDLRQAAGRRADELYRFVYWRSWQLLSEPARRVLTVMPLVADSGGSLEQIASLSELAEDELGAALEQLVSLCLVDVRGTVEVRRYSIHRLTETFLLNEVLRWQAVH